MSATLVSIDPASISQAELYRLMIGGVVPRPIATVSTLSADGIANVAPYSFYNAVSSDPPCLSVSISRNSKGLKKDTLLNIESSGEFVVNATPVSLAAKINQASAEYPHAVSEFAEAGLTPAPSLKVKAPRVAESPLSFECVLHAKLEIGSGQQGSTTLVVGRIVAVQIDTRILRDGRIDAALFDPLSRLGGLQYGQTAGIFELPRPKLP